MNRSVSQEIKTNYRIELKSIERYKKPLINRILFGVFEAIKSIIIYALGIAVFILFWSIPVAIEPIGEFLECNLIAMLIISLIWLVLGILAVKCFFAMLLTIPERFLVGFSVKGKKYDAEKEKIDNKYNELGYFPQFETKSDIEKAIIEDRHCVYYDDCAEVFRCPVDDSIKGTTDHICFGTSVCMNCEKLKREI